MTDGLDQFRRCLICGAASDRECNGGPDDVCGPFALTMPLVDLHPTFTPPALTALAERGFVRINDPRCGVPPYTPTEEQPTRIGGTEA